MSVESCRGWTTRLAGSDSVGHAYLFDILRSEMRFFPPTSDLSLPVFHFFSLALVYEVGSELWQLAAIEKILRESLPRSKARSNLGASVLDVRTTRIGRLIGRSFPSFFFFFFLFKKLSNSFSSPPLNTVQFVTFGVCAKFK